MCLSTHRKVHRKGQKRIKQNFSVCRGKDVQFSGVSFGGNGFREYALQTGIIGKEEAHSLTPSASTENKHFHFVVKAKRKLCLDKPLKGKVME